MSDDPVKQLPPSSLNTFVQLLAQRIGYAEIDINRLGDKSRKHSSDIDEMRSELHKTDELQEQRIARLESDQKEIITRFWTVMLGLVGTVLAIAAEAIFRKK